MPILWAVAVLTMVVVVTCWPSRSATSSACSAYSSVANAGYILVAVVTDTQSSLTALLVYLAAYAAMNLGAFGGVLAVERDNGFGTSLDDFAGLARRRPGLAAAMALFLFALAGIPATVGFVGKFNVFYAAITGGHLELAIIGVLASALGMFYYLRVIWAMYFIVPAPVVEPAVAIVEAPVAAPPVARGGGSGAGTVAVAEPMTKVAVARVKIAAKTAGPRMTPGVWLALTLAAALTLALGIIPGPLFDLARQAASAIFP